MRWTSGAPLSRPFCRRYSNTLSATDGSLTAGGGAGDERGIAPGQVPRRCLRAGVAIELLRHVAARRGEDAHGPEKSVATLQPGASLVLALCRARAKTELGAGQRRDVPGSAGKIGI